MGSGGVLSPIYLYSIRNERGRVSYGCSASVDD
jgi:hypothetical protein